MADAPRLPPPGRARFPARPVVSPAPAYVPPPRPPEAWHVTWARGAPARARAARLAALAERRAAAGLAPLGLTANPERPHA
ncbi:hypothetical protein [Lichenibacterium dinghuense]|uniref:hypothetical protein n=1 Tax=Lichenibacterium dinghuense TaxID=2895977 RepID=UPI001F3D7DAD|nr:hypothetical protein [Lichenibacterium sp. 6Y81]